MSFKASVFRGLGGFDEEYRGIGDWSEPDLCYRIRLRWDYESALYLPSQYKLWFSQSAALFHLPSQSGAFSKRKRTGARLTNYALFSKRWIRPCWQHAFYKLFIRSYYAWREIRSSIP